MYRISITFEIQSIKKKVYGVKGDDRRLFKDQDLFLRHEKGNSNHQASDEFILPEFRIN